MDEIQSAIGYRILRHNHGFKNNVSKISSFRRYLVLIYSATASYDDNCLTGDMTDVQSWVDANGNIIAKDSRKQINTLDVSLNENPAALMRSLLVVTPRFDIDKIIYLNMARCKMRTLPQVFDITDPKGRKISTTVEYITLFGNDFRDFERYHQEYKISFNATGAKEVSFGSKFGRNVEAVWPMGFRNTNFLKLKELDLRCCKIQTLDNYIFIGMPKLEALYMSGNNIFFIAHRAFVGLKNLKHLDLSRNDVVDENGNEKSLFWDFSDDPNVPTKLVSLDLSYTRITRKTIQAMGGLGRNFERLSLCHSKVSSLDEKFFKKTSLRLLDVSGNPGILNGRNTLGGIEDTLEVIYADDIGLTNVDIFKGFKNLKILKAVNNFVETVNVNVSKSLNSLEILSLDFNRIKTWFDPTFEPMVSLKLLSLRNNNINLIKAEMIKDMRHIRYLGLSGNFFICSCNVGDLYNIATANDRSGKCSTFSRYLEKSEPKFKFYHTGYEYFAQMTKRYKRGNKTEDNNKDNYQRSAEEELTGDFVLYDYDLNSYKCLIAHAGTTISFADEDGCHYKRDLSYDDVIVQNWNKLLLIVLIPMMLVILLFVGYYFRRSFKYFYITVRNSAMLSLIDGKEFNEGTIFNYDVFVSYCNEDRPWVLDKLLPQVEKDCNVSVCLHERDFQVGLSILENIVSCMDRSRSIMLVISQRFLLSQWCQFEMHLAQHRLLETRREDLILILLEDIPRRLRPNTLHYLMLTKTYVQWPEDPDEIPLFWRRLKKCLVTQKLRQVENVSLAKFC